MMMLNYRTPGVYFEYPDSFPFAIGPRRTDIAGFVGIAARGPLHQPVKLNSWTQFKSIFGEHISQGYLAYAVEGFFENGGLICWVIRVADPVQSHPATLLLSNEMGRPILFLVATSPGLWGEHITIIVEKTGEDYFTFRIQCEGVGREEWPNLSFLQDKRFAGDIINDTQTGSRLIRAYEPNTEYVSPQARISALKIDRRITRSRLQGGKDGIKTLTVDHFDGEGLVPDVTSFSNTTDMTIRPWGLRALELIDEVSIVVMPDIMPKPTVNNPIKKRRLPCERLMQEETIPFESNVISEDAPVFSDGQILHLQLALIRHCEKLKDRVGILDTKLNDLQPGVPLSQVITHRRQFQSKFAALYYPWILVADRDQSASEGDLRAVPPCGHVAGIFARVDQRVGVHKPPANEEVRGAHDVSIWVDERKHGDLNDQNINVIRSTSGRGIRLAGARTLSTDPLWYYINVRRLLIMIAEAIEEQTQWTVFEPNNPDQWHEIDRVVRRFFDDLWQRGALDGVTAEEAYFVKCDESTNPPDRTNLGIMTCLAGMQPPWPAEFVVVRIGKTESGTEISEIAEV